MTEADIRNAAAAIMDAAAIGMTCIKDDWRPLVTGNLAETNIPVTTINRQHYALHRITAKPVILKEPLDVNRLRAAIVKGLKHINTIYRGDSKISMWWLPEVSVNWHSEHRWRITVWTVMGTRSTDTFTPKLRLCKCCGQRIKEDNVQT